jgi:hypothetical protein
MGDARVCILVLNWNGADDTLGCLTSLQELSYDKYEAVVIDNGSDDDSVSRIKQAFPKNHMIELESNLLYGGGNNVGLKWAAEQGFDFVVFLNNDTTVEPDFLEPLLSAFNKNEQVGISAPLMCYSANPDKVWYGGGKVNLWTGTIAHYHIRDSVNSIDLITQKTEYITGCCLMMPVSVAKEFGGFNPAFKMYGEDVDLSLRCTGAGYELIFVPQSRIYHKVSASVGGEYGFLKLIRKFRGMMQIYSRHAAWYQWPSIIISQILFSLPNLMILITQRLKSGTEQR